MTISPPPKVKSTPIYPFQILASGFDTLVLAIDVQWEDEAFFDYLKRMKTLAIEDEKDVAAILRSRSGEDLWLCAIKPHGSKGYEWILAGNEYTLTIGNWLEPKSRPSIMAHIHSEALWRLGPHYAVDFLLNILVENNGSIITVKPSRVDLCADIVFPETLWRVGLIEFRVTRACYAAPHFYNHSLTGISIGKGKVSARLYDKPLEIRQKSKKFWMYDVWDVEAIPDDLKVIRTEAQFRREAIKELGIDSIYELFDHVENLWAYFSQQWLKFQDNPGKHHNQRSTFSWWQVIQNGFLGVQKATPLIRCKALSTKKMQLFAQTYGTMNSLIAIEQDENGLSLQHETSLENCISDFLRYAKLAGKNEFELNIDILNKKAKYQRTKERMISVHRKRLALGHPSNLPVGEILLKQKYKKEEEKAIWKNILPRRNLVQE